MTPAFITPPRCHEIDPLVLTSDSSEEGDGFNSIESLTSTSAADQCPADLSDEEDGHYIDESLVRYGFGHFPDEPIPSAEPGTSAAIPRTVGKDSDSDSDCICI